MALFLSSKNVRITIIASDSTAYIRLPSIKLGLFFQSTAERAENAEILQLIYVFLCDPSGLGGKEKLDLNWVCFAYQTMKEHIRFVIFDMD